MHNKKKEDFIQKGVKNNLFFFFLRFISCTHAVEMNKKKTHFPGGTKRFSAQAARFRHAISGDKRTL